MGSIRRSFMVALAACCAISVSAQQPPASPDEASIVEQLRTTMRFENDGTGRRETYMRVKAQSEAGAAQFHSCA